MSGWGQCGTTAGGEDGPAQQLAAFVTSAAGGALVLRGAADAGRSGLMHGAADAGRSGLLARAAALAEQEGRAVVRAAGVEVESALPWAGLHQLLHPLLADAARLDDRTRAVFDTVFGGLWDEAPSVMTVGIAVLRLLALATEQRPLLLVLDDGQWLDDASADVCGFVGRRLTGRPVQLLVAVGGGLPSRFDAAALPELPLAARPGGSGPALTDLRAARSSRSASAAEPGSLTWQERRVADLAAGGLTNKQIGVRMHLSPRTVSSHLYRVFPKLGVTSRAGLRDALSRAAG